MISKDFQSASELSVRLALIPWECYNRAYDFSEVT